MLKESVRKRKKSQQGTFPEQLQKTSLIKTGQFNQSVDYNS